MLTIITYVLIHWDAQDSSLQLTAAAHAVTLVYVTLLVGIHLTSFSSVLYETVHT